MNVALVEHSQDDIDRDQRRQNQPRLACQRRLERLGRALKGRPNIRGNSQLQHGSLDIFYSVTQRHVLAQVERYRHRRKLPLMVDSEGCCLHFKMGECAQRDLRPRRRPHKKLLDRVRAVAERRIHFHHNVVLVQLRVDRRHLPLTKSVVQSGVDRLRSNSQPGSCVPVDDERCLEAARLLIRVNIPQT